MICEACNKCQSYSVENDIHKIKCKESGSFKIHETNADRFQCEDFVDYIPPEEPLKDNVMVVLKGSGRDFIVRDDRIKSVKLLDDAIIVNPAEYVSLGGITFKVDEIAAYSYLGD